MLLDRTGCWRGEIIYRLGANILSELQIVRANRILKSNLFCMLKANIQLEQTGCWCQQVVKLERGSFSQARSQQIPG
jgi:hypothetical protein